MSHVGSGDKKKEYSRKKEEKEEKEGMYQPKNQVGFLYGLVFVPGNKITHTG